ncbi:TMV resistance protein N-like [Humulus lupulus]|uniref:TMV resistance protein N-like n=1 Tax=Humulus lupulus TaxID=3486 RepID=UPI002B406270|nr:TMV resistance protein N-like [Humulus lupulus]
MEVDDDQLSILASLKKYDVFISFNGEIRNNFFSHLCRAFNNIGIKIFFDDKIDRGEEISKALFDAIDQSKFCLIIFSKNYACSSWCLDELVYILEKKQKKELIVLPVFYYVEPSIVRRQKDTFETAFFNHEKCYNDTIIHNWRVALIKAAGLSGWDASKIRNDDELVNDIVNHIQAKLGSASKQELDGIDKASIGRLCGMGTSVKLGSKL